MSALGPNGLGADQVLFVLNPTAGGGRGARLKKQLKEKLQRLGPMTPERWIEETDADKASERLRQALQNEDIQRVVAVGGDGTVHGVAHCLLDTKAAERVALGVVPAGTGSDFARCLGLSRKPKIALKRALTVEPRPVDAIAVQTDSGKKTFCLNIASAGLSGAVDEAVNAQTIHASYLWTTLKAVLAYRPVSCRVSVDGKPLVDGPFFVVAMANGKFFGKGMKVAPDAEVDDGWLDVVLVPPVPKWQLPIRLPQFLAGLHIRLPEVKVIRGREVRVDPPAGFFPYDLDGETLDSEGATFKILPGALRFCV